MYKWYLDIETGRVYRNAITPTRTPIEKLILLRASSGLRLPLSTSTVLTSPHFLPTLEP